MSTISVTKDVKEALLRIASELQTRWGRRVDLNEVIRYLINKGVKKPDLLDKACEPIEGFEEAYKELKEERRKDEERAFRKFGLR
jgi:predicted CopG family antitoxin